jgi:hypothetical protein
VNENELIEEVAVLREALARVEADLVLSRAEAQRLRTVIMHAYHCIPDMNAVCVQTIQLAVEGGNV